MELLDFDAYLTWAFDRPVPTSPEGEHWWWTVEDEQVEWTGSGAVVAQHLTQLFRTPRLAFDRFSRPRLGQGLWFLISGARRSHLATALESDALAVAEKRTLILSMEVLFEEGFAPNVTDVFDSDDLLDMTCAMWFDICGGYERSLGDPPRAWDDAYLQVMHRVLSSRSIACQRAALHGFGHWYEAYPAEAKTAVDRWLAHGGRDPRLVAYARRARVGEVL